MSHPIFLLIADPIFGEKVFLTVLETNFTKHSACDANFQFQNHELFEKVH